jgi:hypothetical protein
MPKLAIQKLPCRFVTIAHTILHQWLQQKEKNEDIA